MGCANSSATETNPLQRPSPPANEIQVIGGIRPMTSRQLVKSPPYRHGSPISLVSFFLFCQNNFK